jgi:hypothetical protein
MFRHIRLGWVAMFLSLPIVANAQQDITLSSGGADQIWQGTQPGQNVGVWMDLGALSNDGRRDLIVGAPGTGSMTGAVYVVFGGPDPTGTTVSLSKAQMVINGPAAGDRFGISTATGNIVSVEGAPQKDLAVGAPGVNGGAGAVYLFAAGTGWTIGTHLTTADAVMSIIGAPGDQLGTALATGDLDNDGHREIIIGAPGNNRVYVIKGSASMHGTIDLGAAPSMAAATFSAPGIGSVLAAGDITGDAIYDIFMGAPAHNIVYAAVGAPGAIPTTAALSFSGVNAGDEAGASIRLLDIDNDGQQDLAIGAPGSDGPSNGRTDAGSVSLFIGPVSAAAHSLSEADAVFYGAQPNYRAGAGMATGNVNRDIYSSLIILSPGGASGAGQIDVYYGRPRSSIGTSNGAQRVVDLAVSGQASRRIFGDPALGSIAAIAAFEVTGEGARDIIVGVPTVNGSTGELFFTISPRLLISRSSQSLVTNAGSSATSSTAVIVTNPSVVVTGWQATSTASWLSASPANGSIDATHPASFYIVASTSGLGPGTYTGRINVTSMSPDLVQTLPVTVTLTVSDARIAIETPADGATVSNGFQVAGWAAELAASSGTGVIDVEGYAYPRGGGSPIYLGAAAYGGARADVASVYGAQFTNTGYSLSVSNLTPGASYEIAMFVKSTVTNTFATAKTVNVSVAAGSPAPGPTPPDPNPAPPSDPAPGPSPSPNPTPTGDTRVAVNRTALYFGAASASVRTAAQTVMVTFTDGSASWTATADVPWLTITPASGAGNGQFTVTATATTAATMTATITVTASGVSNSPLTIPVTFTWLNAPTPANGYFDTPTDNSTGVVGSLAVTGWAVDDIGVTQVTLWRDPVAGEPVSSVNGKVFIGNAVLVDGVRPDVESIFHSPFNYQAGWGYMLLTNLLPNQGNGTYTLYAYADDVDGHRTLLGARTFTGDNAHATKPFGTIDTPAQGAQVSGTSYVNWGWVLGAQGNAIPVDGSTITVYIDGVAMGHPTYNVNRSDIETLFPGHANTSGAVGYFAFDTTKLSNGVHTIVWGASDSAGHAEGLGSRYFTVFNSTAAQQPSRTSAVRASSEAAPSVGSQTNQSVSTLKDVPNAGEPIYVQKGYAADAPIQLTESSLAGSHVTANELELVRLTIGSPVADPKGGYEGYMIKGGQLAPLPPGTFLDRHTGQFSWQPSAGVIGVYDFEFIRTEYRARTRIPVTIEMKPRARDRDELLASRVIRY